MSASASSGFIKRSLYHGLLPQTPAIFEEFLKDHDAKLPRDGAGHSAPVQAFLQELDKNPNKDQIIALFNDAINQAKKYKKWADKRLEFNNFDEFLVHADQVVAGAPKFFKAKVDDIITIGEPIGVPLYLLFDLISNTSAGYALLNRQDFNDAVRALLEKWGDYLANDEGSSDTLEGWFSKEGLAVLESGLGNLSFDDTYVTQVAPPKRYKTWDAFFTRKFKEKRPPPHSDEDVRPIPKQPDSYYFLYNPCESTIFRTATNIQERDTFWTKGQNYSLYDMLGVETVDAKEYPDYAQNVGNYIKRLEGGSVIQAFLAPQDFHSWHSPATGTIKAAVRLKGTYYAVLPDEGAPEYDLDLTPGDPHGAMIRSQPWLSVVATRAVYIIEPESQSNIDLIAFIPIGMVEVSSCEIIISGGGVNVGQEIGTFHFGGSTYAMVVKPKEGYKVIFQDVYDTPLRPGQHRWVNSVVAQIRKE